jgi:hypothetical protein
MSDIYDLQLKTSYAAGSPDVSSLIFAVPQASLPNTTLLSYNSVVAPTTVGSNLTSTIVNITRTASTYSVVYTGSTFDFDITHNSLEVATNPSTVSTLFVANKTFQTDYKITFNFDALTIGGPIPTVTPPNITNQMTVLVDGVTAGLITNSPGNSLTLSLPAGILYTFNAARSGGLINVSLTIQSLLLPSTPETHALYSVPDIYGVAQLGLIIFDGVITYTPVSLNQVAISVVFAPGGLSVTSIPVILPQDNPTTITINTSITFAGGIRQILNYFDSVGFDFVRPASPDDDYFQIQSGTNTYIITAVPPPVPILVTIEPFCIHPNAMISTNRGMVRLGDIKSKWCLQIEDYKGAFIPFVHNIKFGGSSKFVRFDIGSIGPGKPSRPLLLTEGHPILIDGKERTSKSLINNTTITLIDEPANATYCLATTERTFVNVDGVHVCTWCLPELEKFAKEKGVYYQIV